MILHFLRSLIFSVSLSKKLLFFSTKISPPFLTITHAREMSYESVINPIESKPPINLVPLSSTVNRTIPELISQLRSAFRKAEFDEVERILLDREEKLNGNVKELRSQVETLGKRYDVMERKHGEIALEKLEMEDQVKKYQRECEMMKEKLTRANEDIRVLSDRGKRAEERFNEFYSDFEKKENEKKEMRLQLNEKIAELKGEKRKAEDLANNWKKKYAEYEPRLKKLEEDIALILSENPVLARIIEAESPAQGLDSDKKSARDFSVPEVNDVMDPALGNVNPELVEPQNQGILSNGDEKIHASPGAGSTTNSPVIGVNGSQKAGFREVIEICDSDDEMCTGDRTASASKTGKDDEMTWKDSAIPFMTKRKRALSCNASSSGIGDDDINQIGKRRMKSLYSKISDTDESSDSGDESITDSYMDKLVAGKSKSKAFEFEADMLHGFEENDELCMSAVCALYRQQKFVKAPLPSNNRGFSPLFAIRGKVLAEFLTDGDSQGKLKKSVSELKQYDSKGISECRNLARRHSKQLFQIYQKEDDPFFGPS